jgi:hypothetical protein
MLSLPPNIRRPLSITIIDKFNYDPLDATKFIHISHIRYLNP